MTVTPAATPALGAISGLNVPRLPGRRSRSAKRSYTSYSDLDRVSCLILCASVGIADASDTLNVPQRTLRGWVADVGGLAGLRTEVRRALGVTQYALALRVCDSIAERLPEFTPSQLLDAFQALGIGAAVLSGLPADATPSDAPPGSPVTVTVQLVGARGEVESVPLDAVRAAAATPRVIGGLSRPVPDDRTEQDEKPPDADPDPIQPASQ